MTDCVIYGGDYRGNCPKEAEDQQAFIEYLRKVHKNTYGALVVHIKNEGKKTWGQIAYDKKHGQTTGASDIFIPGSPSFVCELKRKDRTKSKVTSEQVAYLDAAMKAGSFACVAYGYDAAVMAFNDWAKK